MERSTPLLCSPRKKTDSALSSPAHASTVPFSTSPSASFPFTSSSPPAALSSVLAISSSLASVASSFLSVEPVGASSPPYPFLLAESEVKHVTLFPLVHETPKARSLSQEYYERAKLVCDVLTASKLQAASEEAVGTEHRHYLWNNWAPLCRMSASASAAELREVEKAMRMRHRAEMLWYRRAPGFQLFVKVTDIHTHTNTNTNSYATPNSALTGMPVQRQAAHLAPIV